MRMTMRMPMLAMAGATLILTAAAAPHGNPFGEKPATPQQEGPRAGNSECAPSGADPGDARYACPQNRPVELPPDLPRV